MFTLSCPTASSSFLCESGHDHRIAAYEVELLDSLLKKEGLDFNTVRDVWQTLQRENLHAASHIGVGSTSSSRLQCESGPDLICVTHPRTVL